MSTAANHISAKQLASMKDDGRRYELIKGELRMMSPAGGRHGLIAMQIGGLLRNHVTDQNLGAVFAAETGFLIATDPDTVRAPDVAFVSSARLATLSSLDGYLPLAPDLAVEVVSPNDSSSQVEGKANMWIEVGSKLVLVVDPERQSIRVYHNAVSIEVLQVGDEFDGEDVVPGWKLKVDDAFPA